MEKTVKNQALGAGMGETLSAGSRHTLATSPGQSDTEEYVSKNHLCWIFFAIDAKSTSMRRAIAERLAKDEPVLVIERPVSLMRDRTLKPLQSRVSPLSVRKGSWRYRPLHFPERLPGLGKIARVLNDWALRTEVDRLLPKSLARLVCYDSPTHDRLVGTLGETRSIYIAVDDRTVKVTGEPILGEQDAERKLLAKVDLVICVSETLAEILRGRSPSSAKPPIVVLPNGYDERIFDSSPGTPEPAALRNIARPRILVAGHISDRIDWAGVGEAARLRPKWTWVFLGSIDPGLQEKIRYTLADRGFWHPPIPVKQVPGWIEHCDACAIPYRLNSFTRASYPLKLMEYLALGAPTLSTRVPALQRYDEMIEWVKEGDGGTYASALDRVLSTKADVPLKTLRQKAVARDSWALRTESFKKIVCAVAERVSPPSHLVGAPSPAPEAALDRTLLESVSKG